MVYRVDGWTVADRAVVAVFGREAAGILSVTRACVCAGARLSGLLTDAAGRPGVPAVLPSRSTPGAFMRPVLSAVM